MYVVFADFLLSLHTNRLKQTTNIDIYKLPNGTSL